VILLGDTAMRTAGLEAASRLMVASADPGDAPRVRLLSETFAARHERGAGIPAVERLAYLAEFATAQLAGARHLILAGGRSPVSFFAYPGQPGSLVPPGCQVHVLAAPGEDVTGALSALADLIAPDAKPAVQPSERPALPDGDLDGPSAAAVIGALLPEAAIVCDEANTSGLWLAGATAGARPHDWLSLTGGAIGQGLPLATGAAMACPDRRVIALEADGSAMYTISALWTHAREQLDITTVIFSNRKYAILGMELGRVGAANSAGVDVAGAGTATSAASSLIDLSKPDIDFTALAAGMGVPASRACTVAEFATQLRHALAEPGPHLIEVVLPPAL
jgi:acetolactate synthase-1/2/3 large subunit